MRRVEERGVGAGLLCQQRKRERGWNFNVASYGRQGRSDRCSAKPLCQAAKSLVYVKLLRNADRAAT